MATDMFMQYILPALIILPFFILWLLSMYWLFTIFTFRSKIKKIRPDLAFKLYFFEPTKTFEFAFKAIFYQLTLGFFSKERTEKHLDEFFNIKAVKKLNNAELNKYIKRIFLLNKILSIGTFIFEAIILLAVIYGLIALLLYHIFYK